MHTAQPVEYGFEDACQNCRIQALDEQIAAYREEAKVAQTGSQSWTAIDRVQRLTATRAETVAEIQAQNLTVTGFIRRSMKSMVFQSDV